MRRVKGKRKIERLSKKERKACEKILFKFYQEIRRVFERTYGINAIKKFYGALGKVLKYFAKIGVRLRAIEQADRTKDSPTPP